MWLTAADGHPRILLEIAWGQRFARCWYFDNHERRFLGAEYRRDDDHLSLVLCEAWEYDRPDQPEFAEQISAYHKSRFPINEPATHYTSFQGGLGGGKTIVDPEPTGPLTIPVPRFGDWMALARLSQPYRLVDSTSAHPVAPSGVIAPQPWHPKVTVPTDRGSQIPGVAALARTAIRLHPRPAEPTVWDSHLGGPLSWPAGEPWPHCSAGHVDDDGRPREAAFVAGAQFFRRDFPSLPFPEERDLLQVLWCPSADDDRHEDYGPAVRLVWQDSTRLPEQAFTAPAPVVAEYDEEHLPREACVLSPCAVTEYPHLYEIPSPIRETLSFLDERGYSARSDDWPSLRSGSKIGGWTPWWQTGPLTFSCRDCDADLRLLLSLHTGEHPDHLCSCPGDERQPVGWAFGREGALNIFACPAEVTHGVRICVD